MELFPLPRVRHRLVYITKQIASLRAMLQIIIDLRDRQRYPALKMALGVQTSVISSAKVCNHCNYKGANSCDRAEPCVFYPFILSIVHSVTRSSFRSFVRPSILPSLCLSVHPSFRPSIHPSIDTYIHSFTHSVIRPFFLHLFISLIIFIFILDTSTAIRVLLKKFISALVCTCFRLYLSILNRTSHWTVNFVRLD